MLNPLRKLFRRDTKRPGAKDAYCTFCRKSYRAVGPLIEGPGEVYICGECIELCQSILDQERLRRAKYLAHNDETSTNTERPV